MPVMGRLDTGEHGGTIRHRRRASDDSAMASLSTLASAPLVPPNRCARSVKTRPTPKATSRVIHCSAQDRDTSADCC
jgi:hypothetical protein